MKRLTRSNGIERQAKVTLYMRRFGDLYHSKMFVYVEDKVVHNVLKKVKRGKVGFLLMHCIYSPKLMNVRAIGVSYESMPH